MRGPRRGTSRRAPLCWRSSGHRRESVARFETSSCPHRPVFHSVWLALRTGVGRTEWLPPGKDPAAFPGTWRPGGALVVLNKPADAVGRKALTSQQGTFFRLTEKPLGRPPPGHFRGRTIWPPAYSRRSLRWAFGSSETNPPSHHCFAAHADGCGGVVPGGLHPKGRRPGSVPSPSPWPACDPELICA